MAKGTGTPPGLTSSRPARRALAVRRPASIIQDGLPPALLNLLWLQARAAVRRLVGSLRTVRGALLALLAVVMLVLWLVPTALAAAAAPRVDPRHVRDLAPVALLALTVASAVSAGDRAIAFTPAEVNFLFAAPFTRRQLLAYKLSKSAAGSVALALLMSLALRRFSPYWPAAFTGSLLALLFVNLCTTAAGLLQRTLTTRGAGPLRQAAVSAVVLAIAAGVAAVVSRGDAFAQSAAQWVHSPAARVALAPVLPFAWAFAATDPPTVLSWGAAALLVDAALLAAVMRLDANYLEAAAAAGERVYDQAQRARRGDLMPGLGLAGRKSHVPPLPWLGGAGIVAWRQLTTLLRRSPRLLFITVAAAAMMIPLLLIGRRVSTIQPVLLPAVIWLTVMLLGLLRFDFRGDLDQLPWLRSLPLRPLPLAAGQLAVPTAVLALFHVVATASVAAAIEPLRNVALAALVLALPIDLLLVGLENLTFLLFPHRQAAPTELGAMGRQMVLFFMKLLAMMFTLGVAAAVGGLAFFLTRSFPAAVGAAAVILTFAALGSVPLVAAAYRRFDPGSDVPP